MAVNMGKTKNPQNLADASDIFSFFSSVRGTRESEEEDPGKGEGTSLRSGGGMQRRREGVYVGGRS